MIFKVNDEYRVNTIDSANVAIQRYSISEAGNEYWVNISYHPRLSSAVRALIDSPKILVGIENKEQYEQWLKYVDDIVTQCAKNEL